LTSAFFWCNFDIFNNFKEKEVKVAKSKDEKIKGILEKAGLTGDVLENAKDEIVQNIPEKVFTSAIFYLGLIGILIIVGCIALVIANLTVPEGILALGGTAVGGIAGIFTQK
jgi:hypothetical protein